MKKSAGIFALLLSVWSLLAQVPESAMLKVFAAAHRCKPKENVLISPWGIQQCFGMLALSRGGKSSAELDKILNLNDQTAIELQKARVSLQASKKFNSFNGIFFNKKYTLEKSFIKVWIYKGEVLNEVNRPAQNGDRRDNRGDRRNNGERRDRRNGDRRDNRAPRGDRAPRTPRDGGAK